MGGLCERGRVTETGGDDWWGRDGSKMWKKDGKGRLAEGWKEIDLPAMATGETIVCLSR